MQPLVRGCIVARGRSWEDVIGRNRKFSKGTFMKQILATALILAALTRGSMAVDLNTARIDELTGLKGKFNEKEGVYKVTFPRNDVKVVVDGWTMPPFMGLGTWAAFTSTKGGAMVMGDTVLLEDEVNAAMSTALNNSLHVTALHNHFFLIIQKFISCISRVRGPSIRWPVLSEKFMTLPNKFARQIQIRRTHSAQRHCRIKAQLRLRLSTKSLKHKVNQRMEC